MAKFTHVEDLLTKFCTDSDLPRPNLLDENGHTPPSAHSRRSAAHHQRKVTVVVPLHALGIPKKSHSIDITTVSLVQSGQQQKKNKYNQHLLE
jgi:hypothetical protein